MRVEELARKVRKLEKRQSLAQEVLRLVIIGGKTERVIEIPLNRPTRKY